MIPCRDSGLSLLVGYLLEMNRLLTPQEIADYLGVKQSTIYQWTHQGFIPHIKLGRVLRFRQADIAKWLDKRADRGRTSRRMPVDIK